VKQLGKDIAWVLSGIVLVALLAVCGLGLLQLALHFYPRLSDLGGAPWAAWLLVFAIPEAISIVGIVKLWQKRKPLAVGILLTSVIFATHFVMHLVDHWNG